MTVVRKSATAVHDPATNARNHVTVAHEAATNTQGARIDARTSSQTG